MKKSLFVFIVLSFVIFTLMAETQVEINEELGIHTISQNSTTSIRTTRDIPEGGLLLIPDWSADRVMAFDPITGALYDADFIPSDEANLSSPKEAALHPDGNSILVSDQIEDGLLQYDLNGNFIGWFAPAGGVNNNILDNVRGWSLKADGNILVTTASGANTDAIVEFDTSGNHIGNFITNGSGGIDGPFSVLYREAQDDYLVTASSSDAVHQYDNTGSYIGDFVTGIDFPQQISLAANGNLLVAGFSNPSGCYEYTSDGTFVGLYNVVTGLRGVYELPNGNILVTDANGVYEIDRNNTLVNTLFTGASAQFIHFVEGSSGTSFDPPTGVSIEDETGILTWLPPLTPVIDDNFDSYTVGDYIAVVGDDWTTWSGAPGGAEDAQVTDAQSSSPDNSILVELNNDLVVIMEDYTEGTLVVDLKMYVPTGYCGYYNLQQTSTPGEFWGFQIYFQADGQAYADCGIEAALNFSFDHDEWMDCRVIVDLDNDLASYYHNGEWMIEYQWSHGTFGAVQVNQLGGINIFGGANATTTDIPMFYIDDVVLYEVSDEVTGFNLYLDGMLDGSVGDDVTEYMYTSLVEGQEYLAGLSALYGGDESEIIEVTFTYSPVVGFVLPINPLAEIDDYNDIIITWDAPGGTNLRSLSGYKIYKEGTEIAEITNAATHTYTDECLDEGTYEYTITAIYSNPPGESIPTAPVSATVVLNPPSNGTASSNPPNIVVTWDAPARGVDSYNVYRDGILHEEGVTGTLFIDIAVPTGDYIYNLTAVYCGDYESDFSNDAGTLHVDANGVLKPTVTALTGNYPNPFNPTTIISFSLKEAGQVSVNICNMRGQLVKTLVNAELERDFHEFIWDGKDNSGKTTTSGVYFYKMKAGKYQETRKMLLLK